MDFPKVDMNQILSKFRNGVITFGDILKTLETAGVEQGDTICVHSSLFSFGIPTIENDLFLEAIIQAFKIAIGDNGTLIMPAFSYSFCNNQIYDVKNTPSKVGILTEFFRNSKDVSRTNHPIFSFSVYGKKREEFMDIGLDAFSMESVYGKMINTGGKLVMLGAPKGYTLYYVAEETVKVPHRFFKYFEGTIIDQEQEYQITVPYYVRNLDIRSDEDENKVNCYLNDMKIQRSVPLGRGSLSVVSCNEMYSKCVAKLRENPEYFLKEVNV